MNFMTSSTEYKLLGVEDYDVDCNQSALGLLWCAK